MTALPLPLLTSVAAGPYGVELHGDAGPCRPALTCAALEEGVWLVTLVVEASQPVDPPPLRLQWRVPVEDIHGAWRSDAGSNRALPPDWSGAGFISKATSQAPVVCLFAQSGINRMTFACSDPLHPVRMHAGVVEETAELRCEVGVFNGGRSPATRFSVQVRIDVRAVRYHLALDTVSRWWAGLPGCTPSAVPDVGRRPMYSTWYGFHQAVDAAAVEEQCRLARELGCEAIIMDDGWQTLDNRRGYGFTGDWRPERLPDLAGHVRRVHALGLKYLLWYSVPFVGSSSQAHARFAGKFLYGAQDTHAVLDPRYPEVREHIIRTYETALREWDLDGFKLDFVDSFRSDAQTPRGAADGRDYADVDEAVDRLLGDVMARLRALKADVLIEFRQSYVGPLMRRYGNLFRAGDCPNDALGNRVRTIDVRLLCGGTACHADMLMWHPGEPVESAALQVLAILFAVPQISVRLDRLPPAHHAMLRFWLGFWNRHRQVLLDGQLDPRHPELLYPLVTASDAGTLVAAAYGEVVVALPADAPAAVHLVNGTRGGRLVIDCAAALGRRRIEVRDTTGALLSSGEAQVDAGVRALAVPPAGLVSLLAD